MVKLVKMVNLVMQKFVLAAVATKDTPCGQSSKGGTDEVKKCMSVSSVSFVSGRKYDGCKNDETDKNAQTDKTDMQNFAQIFAHTEEMNNKRECA